MVTYNVYRDGSKIASGLTDKIYTDDSLTPNTQYQYQVSAENSAGESELSDPVTVKTNYSEPQSIEVSPKTNNLEVGAERVLTATVLPDTAKQTVAWAVDKDNVATVDNNGKVTAIAAGTATVAVKSTENDVQATATVNVTEPTPEEGA
ncbi:Ig-like domain-containing protein [Virgibacillus pantothenticus]|uniref:Fibronectin type-III domain-containing protein n=1 Tax=Virgibacillus pantothenticus TaxID=1473 RepID=A0A0L0QUX1_VIRPA|nr:Ig-like domain-containing protein [Virgibacillus pantothenticus]KNE22475.1 hypothetical protein AFK71_02315 [Virgibacillus pantothenticus]MED3738093.1 Ig-like domain-containing protein [Virgibacillus pantothenticus]QTY16942.1 Ig-like domain-containing protein [Virgibacillus pantothenticus]SIT16985.1 Ig-like domain (group 2) [Virgibacillus pantothenticus]